MTAMIRAMMAIVRVFIVASVLGSVKTGTA